MNNILAVDHSARTTISTFNHHSRFTCVTISINYQMNNILAIGTVLLSIVDIIYRAYYQYDNVT